MGNSQSGEVLLDLRFLLKIDAFPGTDHQAGRLANDVRSYREAGRHKRPAAKPFKWNFHRKDKTNEQIASDGLIQRVFTM